jgi:hypothetical protein
LGVSIRARWSVGRVSLRAPSEGTAIDAVHGRGRARWAAPSPSRSSCRTVGWLLAVAVLVRIDGTRARGSGLAPSSPGSARRRPTARRALRSMPTTRSMRSPAICTPGAFWRAAGDVPLVMIELPPCCVGQAKERACTQATPPSCVGGHDYDCHRLENSSRGRGRKIARLASACAGCLYAHSSVNAARRLGLQVKFRSTLVGRRGRRLNSTVAAVSAAAGIRRRPLQVSRSRRRAAPPSG